MKNCLLENTFKSWPPAIMTGKRCALEQPGRVIIKLANDGMKKYNSTF